MNKYQNLVISKSGKVILKQYSLMWKMLSICIEIKFEKENGEFVRQKLWVENFESKILSDFKLKQDRYGPVSRLL